MKKFLIIYRTPVAVLEEWMSKPEAERKTEQEQMEAEWNQWMKDHSSLLKETAGAGSTKKVSKDGITDTKNDIMMFSFAEAESQEEVANAFVNHPHFSIPESTIEIMPVNYFPDMN